MVCSLGQDDSLGHKALEERCLVENKNVPLVVSVLVLCPLDKRKVPGIGCSREVSTEVLETGV